LSDLSDRRIGSSGVKREREERERKCERCREKGREREIVEIAIAK
jgi:hypothetical protein